MGALIQSTREGGLRQARSPSTLLLSPVPVRKFAGALLILAGVAMPVLMVP